MTAFNFRHPAVNAVVMNIGDAAWGAAFRGVIDEVAVWNRVLDEAEVARLAEAPRLYAGKITQENKGQWDIWCAAEMAHWDGWGSYRYSRQPRHRLNQPGSSKSGLQGNWLDLQGNWLDL